MWHPLRNWRRRRRLARSDSSEAGWRRAWDALPLLDGMPADDARRLRELASLFLQEKALEPVQGMRLEPWMAQEIALQACLPILNLGLDWYSSWYAVIVYPIVHEAAHKLDALEGGTNGKPPLHANMRVADWSRDFHAAYEDLERRVDAGLEPPIDDYALESPAEFFAVASEGESRRVLRGRQRGLLRGPGPARSRLSRHLSPTSRLLSPGPAGPAQALSGAGRTPEPVRLSPKQR